MKTIKRTFLAVAFLAFATAAYSQIGLGGTLGLDLYQRYANPKDNIASNTAGNAILNINAGPKIWLGGKQLSLSVEAPVSIGLTGFSTKDYKGMGMLAVPVIAGVNFGKLSSFNRDGGIGFGLGFGKQWYKTELYGLDDDFVAKGVKRDWNDVYVIQGDVGFGVSGFVAKLFVRYGFNPDDDDLRTFNIGIQTDYNLMMTKKIDAPESRL